MDVIGSVAPNLTTLKLLEENGDNFQLMLSSIWLPNCSLTDESRSYCFCFRCNEIRCILCCGEENCCSCYGCPPCWNDDANLITAMQVSVFLLFLLGVFSVAIMYCKICARAARRHYPEHRTLQNECNNECIRSGTLHNSIPEIQADRPPPYSEACSAPPLYASPYNRISMLEAPPVYPETPKLSERELHSAGSTPMIAHHI